MARTCEICGKSPVTGNKRSHSNKKTKRRWNPNIKKVKAMVGRSKKRVNVCTRCLKADKVQRAF